MAGDNFVTDSGTGGNTYASDAIGAGPEVHYPILKIAYGALDSATLVTTSSGFPVAQQGTWTVDLGATDNTVLDNIDADLTTIIGHVDGVEGILTTIDADTGSILTAIQLLDNVVVVLGTDTYTEATSSGYALGAVRRDADTTLVNLTNEWGPLQMDANGRLKVEVFSGEALPVTLTSTTITGTVDVTATDLDIRNLVAATDLVDLGGNALASLQKIDNIAHSGGDVALVEHVPISGQFDDVATNTVTENQIAPVRISSRRALLVEGVASGTTIPVTEASGAAAAASLSVMDDWDNAASDGASVSGDVAHDTADAGEPVKIGFKAISPDGTAPPAVAENDRSNLNGDLNGRAYVNTVHPMMWSYHDDDAAAVTTDGTIADPGDGFSLFITDIIFSIGAATASSIFIEEGSTKVLGPYYLEAIAGRGLSIHFETPKKITASTAALVTNTGSILFSIDIHGFTASV